MRTCLTRGRATLQFHYNFMLALPVHPFGVPSISVHQFWPRHFSSLTKATVLIHFASSIHLCMHADPTMISSLKVRWEHQLRIKYKSAGKLLRYIFLHIHCYVIRHILQCRCIGRKYLQQLVGAAGQTRWPIDQLRISVRPSYRAVVCGGAIK